MTKTKKYSPAQVRNPTSLQHVVRVKPGQEILLSLDDEIYQEPQVECSTDLLKISFYEQKGSKRVYHIHHHHDVHDWSEYSNSFLGEIWIDYRDAICKIAVMLDCSTVSKNTFVSVVNPDCADLRLLPHNILEVIVYDKQFSYQDEWHCEWNPLVDNLGLVQLGADHLCLHSWNTYWDYGTLDAPDYEYAKYPRTDCENKNTWTRQHHFWFRFGGDIENIAQEICGIDHVGDIKILGQGNKFNPQLSPKTTYTVSLYMDCRKANIPLLRQVANFKTKDESSPYTFKSNVKNRKPKKKKKKQEHRLIKDVEITLIEQSFDGCKEMSVKPAWEPDPYHGYDPDDDYYPHGFHTQHWPHRVRYD